KFRAAKQFLLTFRVIKHGDVRRDLFFLDQPSEQISRDVSGIADQHFRFERKRSWA
ncbi:MAG: hypothetical protein ACI915_004750, partial [Gammaproteobacteria bacterium]